MREKEKTLIWSKWSDSTSSQCLFRIKCFLSSLSRNRRIRSRSERLSRSRSRSLKKRWHKKNICIKRSFILNYVPLSPQPPPQPPHHPYVHLRLSTSLISLSRCLCLSLSLCSLIWSNDRISFFSLLGDLRSRLFELWRKGEKNV